MLRRFAEWSYTHHDYVDLSQIVRMIWIIRSYWWCASWSNTKLESSLDLELNRVYPVTLFFRTLLLCFVLLIFVFLFFSLLVLDKQPSYRSGHMPFCHGVPPRSCSHRYSCVRLKLVQTCAVSSIILLYSQSYALKAVCETALAEFRSYTVCSVSCIYRP